MSQGPTQHTSFDLPSIAKITHCQCEQLTLILLSSTTGPCGLFFVIVALMTRLKAASCRMGCKQEGGAGEGPSDEVYQLLS